MNCDRCTMATPLEISQNPELALIGVLHQTIALTIRSLAAAHPELSELEFPSWMIHYPSAITARSLIRHLELLSELLPEYRTALIAESLPGKKTPEPRSDPF
jgi:hypothetical protein